MSSGAFLSQPQPLREDDSRQRLSDTDDPERPRVLIVEDNHDTREMYAWCLRASGWLVYAAKDGDQAVFVARLVEPDVIVMDLRLAGVDGLEATRRLKNSEQTRHVPVVACTGLDRAVAEVEARAAGCDAFVRKPCEPDALRELLEVLVGGRTISS